MNHISTGYIITYCTFRFVLLYLGDNMKFVKEIEEIMKILTTLVH